MKIEAHATNIEVNHEFKLGKIGTKNQEEPVPTQIGSNLVNLDCESRQMHAT